MQKFEQIVRVESDSLNVVAIDYRISPVKGGKAVDFFEFQRGSAESLGNHLLVLDLFSGVSEQNIHERNRTCTEVPEAIFQKLDFFFMRRAK